jgi:hypothetical protein
MRLRNPDGALTADEKAIVKALLAEGWRNQDIQALLNIGREATVNGGRITEVKQNNNIKQASPEAVDLFKAKKQSYDPRTGLNEFDHERLIRAREAMILAVQLYNSPALHFKTEVYCVLVNIAWTYLLHEYYHTKKISIVDKDGRSLLLGQMLNRDDCPLSRGIRDNLASLKLIRDAVEHQMMGRTDRTRAPLFQACALNFDKAIRALFGDELSLSDDLAFALQFSKLSLEQISALQEYEIPDHIKALDARLIEGLSDEQLRDTEYQFQVIYTLDATSKSKSHFRFVSPGSEEAIQIHAVLQKYKPSDELYPYKPSKVVQLVAKMSGKAFSTFTHTQAWRKYRARPKNRSDKPSETNKDYCIYHAAHGDYTYSEKWVDHLVKMIGDNDEYEALLAWK